MLKAIYPIRGGIILIIINGIEAQEYKLSYDKIIKNTLAQSDEMTIRFVNGLFGDSIPLDATVAWLDKESVNDKHVGFIADFYPQIAGRLFHIEVEQDDNGDMAIRVFKYTVGGAILHGMNATDTELSVTFPQPCVIFLKSRENTPKSLKWNINFFDGQKVTLEVPTIRLAELSVDEIAGRNLLPIGQFYMRTFEPLTKNKIGSFRAAGVSLLAALKKAVDDKTVPYHIAMQMQETIRMTVENTVSRSGKEVGLTLEANIVETLPWIDFGDVIAKLEERSKAEGRTERDKEIARKAFGRLSKGVSPAVITQSLMDLGISETIIEAARKQAENELTQAKKSAESEKNT